MLPRLAPWLLLALLLPALALASTWTSSDGKTLEADEINYDPANQTVTLQTPADRTYTLPLARLSAPDQAIAKAFQPRPFISIEIDLQPPDDRAASPVYLNGGYTPVKDYSSERAGNVTLVNMSNFPADLNALFVFFDPKSGSKPGAHRNVISHNAYPMHLDPGASNITAVDASAMATVYMATTPGHRIATGDWVDSFAVVLQANDGSLLDLKCSRPEIEQYVRDNYDSILSEIGGNEHRTVVYVNR